MAERPHRAYEKPPLIEAVAEFRFDPNGGWDDRCADYSQAKQSLHSLRARAEGVQEQVEADYVRLKALKAEGLAVQQEQGAHFRATTTWTPEQLAHREDYTRRLADIEQAKRALEAAICVQREERRYLERGPRDD